MLDIDSGRCEHDGGHPLVGVLVSLVPAHLLAVQAPLYTGCFGDFNFYDALSAQDIVPVCAHVLAPVPHGAHYLSVEAVCAPADGVELNEHCVLVDALAHVRPHAAEHTVCC